MLAAATLLAVFTAAPLEADGLHPIAATVRQTITDAGGKPERTFTLVVEINCEDARGCVSAYRDAAAKTRSEEGNLRYDLHRDAAEPTKFLLVERWKSVDALDSHLKQDYTAGFVEFLEANATIKLRVMRPVPGKAPKKKPAE